MITTYQDFVENYLVFDGMLANAENVNKPTDQLKKEIMEVISNLGSLSNSSQVLDLSDAIQVNGKTISIKKGDGTVETIKLDLFDTKMDRIVSIDNRIPKFNGAKGDLSFTAAVIDDSENLIIPGSITSNTGVLVGNASTATKLKTPRTISLTGGVTASATFDGSGNVLLNSEIINNSHTHVSANITDATENNTANTVIKRDSNGNFSAGTITGTLNGNALTSTTAGTTTGNSGTASKWQTPRSISLGGVLSGSVTIDGSANVTLTASHTADPVITLSGGVTGNATMYDLGNVNISATVTNDSHTHDTRYYTKTEEDNRFLNKTAGGSVTGNVTITGYVSADGGLYQDGFAVLNGSDTWLRTSGATGWYNATYSGGMYMSDNTWVRTYGSKSLLTDADFHAGGTGFIGGGLTVGDGKSSSIINMYDSDEGTRQIHCNSNRIGFLTQSGSWGSYCNDDGSWTSDVAMTAPAITGGRITGVGVGNDFSNGGFETRGNGSSIYPSIGFHQPSAYASTLQLRGAAEFAFFAQGAGSYANVTANVFRGTATSANYADLAEKYLTDKEYEVGTVLEFGGEKELTLFNGGTLAGAVSENPGFRLNEGSTGQYVALKGKIPVKCDSIIKKGQYCIATNGKVKGINKKDMTFELTLDLVGIALEDSKNNLVMVKI